MNKKAIITFGIIGGVIIIIWLIIARVKTMNRLDTNATKIYTNVEKSFSIQAPAIWNAQEHIAVSKIGIGTAEEKIQNIEIINLASAEKSGIIMQIYKGMPSCENVKKPNTKLAGFPAFYNERRKTWTIDTTTGRYVVSYYYPGRGIYHGLYRQYPTSLPQSQIDAYEKLFTTILSSFKITHYQPLPC